MAGGGGGGARIVYWCTVSFAHFLKNLDIDEFNKILGHCAYGNDKRFLLLVI
jgi:hypothetical protein